MFISQLFGKKAFMLVKGAVADAFATAGHATVYAPTIVFIAIEPTVECRVGHIGAVNVAPIKCDSNCRSIHNINRPLCQYQLSQ